MSQHKFLLGWIMALMSVVIYSSDVDHHNLSSIEYCFQLFGLSPDVSEDTFNNTYRKIMSLSHPDKWVGTDKHKEFEEKSKLYNAAKEKIEMFYREQKHFLEDKNSAHGLNNFQSTNFSFSDSNWLEQVKNRIIDDALKTLHIPEYCPIDCYKHYLDEDYYHYKPLNNDNYYNVYRARLEQHLKQKQQKLKDLKISFEKGIISKDKFEASCCKVEEDYTKYYQDLEEKAVKAFDQSVQSLKLELSPLIYPESKDHLILIGDSSSSNKKKGKLDELLELKKEIEKQKEKLKSINKREFRDIVEGIKQKLQNLTRQYNREFRNLESYNDFIRYFQSSSIKKVIEAKALLGLPIDRPYSDSEIETIYESFKNIELSGLFVEKIVKAFLIVCQHDIRLIERLEDFKKKLYEKIKKLEDEYEVSEKRILGFYDIKKKYTRISAALNFLFLSVGASEKEIYNRYIALRKYVDSNSIKIFNDQMAVLREYGLLPDEQNIDQESTSTDMIAPDVIKTIISVMQNLRFCTGHTIYENYAKHELGIISFNLSKNDFLFNKGLVLSKDDTPSKETMYQLSLANLAYKVLLDTYERRYYASSEKHKFSQNDLIMSLKSEVSSFRNDDSEWQKILEAMKLPENYTKLQLDEQCVQCMRTFNGFHKREIYEKITAIYKILNKPFERRAICPSGFSEKPSNKDADVIQKIMGLGDNYSKRDLDDFIYISELDDKVLRENAFVELDLYEEQGGHSSFSMPVLLGLGDESLDNDYVSTLLFDDNKSADFFKLGQLYENCISDAQKHMNLEDGYSQEDLDKAYLVNKLLCSNSKKDILVRAYLSLYMHLTQRRYFGMTMLFNPVFRFPEIVVQEKKNNNEEIARKILGLSSEESLKDSDVLYSNGLSQSVTLGIQEMCSILKDKLRLQELNVPSALTASLRDTDANDPNSRSNSVPLSSHTAQLSTVNVSGSSTACHNQIGSNNNGAQPDHQEIQNAFRTLGLAENSSWSKIKARLRQIQEDSCISNEVASLSQEAQGISEQLSFLRSEQSRKFDEKKKRAQKARAILENARQAENVMSQEQTIEQALQIMQIRRNYSLSDLDSAYENFTIAASGDEMGKIDAAYKVLIENFKRRNASSVYATSAAACASAAACSSSTASSIIISQTELQDPEVEKACLVLGVLQDSSWSTICDRYTYVTEDEPKPLSAEIGQLELEYRKKKEVLEERQAKTRNAIDVVKRARNETILPYQKK